MTDEPIPWATVRRLLERGVPTEMAVRMTQLRVVDGEIVFFEEADDDLVLWNIETGNVAAWAGRAFALGGSDLNASSGVLRPLYIWGDPLDWLRDRARGIVVVDWHRAFDRLRDIPAVAVAESVLPAYRRAMRPRVPQLSVVTDDRRLAA